MLDESTSVFMHGLAPHITLFNLNQLFQCLLILLLVDVMNNQVLIAFNIICEVNALLDLAMSLKELVERVLVNVVFIVLQEISEFLFISVYDSHHNFSHLRGEFHALADLHFNVIVQLDIDFVDVS